MSIVLYFFPQSNLDTIISMQKRGNTRNWFIPIAAIFTFLIVSSDDRISMWLFVLSDDRRQWWWNTVIINTKEKLITDPVSESIVSVIKVGQHWNQKKKKSKHLNAQCFYVFWSIKAVILGPHSDLYFVLPDFSRTYSSVYSTLNPVWISRKQHFLLSRLHPLAKTLYFCCVGV